MSATDLRDAIIIKSQAGVGLREIEETMIEGSGLPEDEQAALWLLAWSLPIARRQRDPKRQSTSVLREPGPGGPNEEYFHDACYLDLDGRAVNDLS